MSKNLNNAIEKAKLKEIKTLRKNLKRLVSLIIFFQTKREKQTMISLGTRRLKVAEAEDPVDLIPHHFLTFLKIFLVTLVGEAPLGDPIIEEMT